MLVTLFFLVAAVVLFFMAVFCVTATVMQSAPECRGDGGFWCYVGANGDDTD